MNRSYASKLRVLVVDDNRDAADSLAFLLEMKGYEVRVAYDGLAGLIVAQLFAPDCLLADIRMPQLDGYSLARHIRNTPSLTGVKLVALSSYADDAHVEKATEAGFDYRLTKGCSPEQVLEVLRMIEEIKNLAAKTQELAKQNVELAGQTKDILREVKEDVKEVKKEVKELKKEVKELKEDQRERNDSSNGGAGSATAP